MLPFFVYMLRCSDGSYYVGHTDDLRTRVAKHQLGLVGGYTARRRPVELVFSDRFTTRERALELELQLKGWSRRKKEALIAGDWNAIHGLARCKGRPSTRSGADAPDLAQGERMRENGTGTGTGTGNGTGTGTAAAPAPATRGAARARCR